MTNHSNQARAIFLEALEHSSQDRDDFLAKACVGDAELRARVERLLQSHELLGSFHDDSPFAATVDQPVAKVTEQPGDTIGPYKLLQQIGEGGMGVVYMAEQSEPVERRVALKIIKPGMDTRQVIARFEAERQALAMMDHPNIAKVLDAGTTDTGRPYFVMELVKGLPITQFCDDQHLTPRERLELFLPICQAVQHAHQKGVIHRDLKPSNILIARYDDKAVPKVIDFGVSKAVSQRLTEKTVFTQYGQVVGTIEYMSPEQAQFNQLDVDTRSDIYSLGVLLYELLTGGTPFDKQRLRAAAFDELLRIIREEEPPRPSVRLSTCATLPSIAANRHVEPGKLSVLVRGELDWIVMKALEKDRTRRYETASAFAADVRHYLNDEAVVACPPSAGYRFRKFARRNRATIATTTTIAIALIAGAGVATWQAIRATQERDRAVIAEANALDAGQQARDDSERARIAEAWALTQFERAQESADMAIAIVQFLQYDLLGMADPDELLDAELSPEPNVRLRTVLDRAAAGIEGQFPDQPLVEAALCQTMGWTYIQLGEYEVAERLLQHALERRQDVLGSEHPNTLSTINGLAAAFSFERRYDEAEAMRRELVATYQRTLGPEHPATLTSMSNLASTINMQGRHAEAEAMHCETLAIKQAVLTPEHSSTLRSMSGLASAINRQGRNAEAEELFREVVEIQRRVLGLEHPSTLTSMINLANAINQQGRQTEAEELYREVLELRERVLGPQHPFTLAARRNLRACYGNWSRDLATAVDPEARDYDRAAELAEAAIPLYPDPIDRSVADWGHIAQMQYRTGRFADARASLEQVIALREDDGPSMESGPRWWYYTMTLAQLGETTRARTYYDQLSQIMSEHPPDDPELYEVLQSEAAALLELNLGPETSLGSTVPVIPMEE